MAKKLYTLKQIAFSYGRALTTTHGHIQKLIITGKFVKKSIGSFTEKEIEQLEFLLDFKIGK